jgi:hypothetical protein
MIAQTTHTMQVLWDELKDGQDIAATIANLLTNVDHPPVHQ